MATGSRWGARVALMVSILMFGLVMGAFEAFGMGGGPLPPIDGLPIVDQTSASASPSKSPSPSPSSTPCRLPAPPPVCPSSPPASSSPSPTPTGSPSPSPTPGGEPERHDSKITINYTAAFRTTPASFDGVVRSVTKCKSKREVLLKRVIEGPDATVGRDTTNRKGEWKIVEGAAKGRYYAKLIKRKFTANDTDVICGGARSRTVRAS